jgi:CubicO group peptidase (beta-lactamase class C family)
MKYHIYLLAISLVSQLGYGQPSDCENFIVTYAKEHNYNGTVLTSRAGKITYQNSFGLANREFKIPATNETRYKIASVTKTFTAVLIMQLVEKGEISLEDPIIKYLPRYKGEAAVKVTVHQLLNHTSGMENIDTITSQAGAIRNGIVHYQLPFTIDSLIAKFCSGRLVNVPGEKFDYNNAEYIILGRIIEEIYKKSFGQVLSEKILVPLNMMNTGMVNQDTIIDNLASSYFTNSTLNKLVNDLPVYFENWYASGAMYSTARDLNKFAEALYGGKLLKPASLDLMLTPGLDKYGFSVWVDDIEVKGKNYKIIFRPGSIMGTNAAFYHIPEKNITVILLTNTDMSDTDNYVYQIAKRLLE